MQLHIEISAFHRGQAHGAIWLSDGTALPISMPIDSYHIAVERGLFKIDDEVDALLPDEDGVLNTSHLFEPSHSLPFP